MPAIAVNYDQATQADRLIRIAQLSRDGFQFNFFPTAGIIPPTWNILGDWTIGSGGAEPAGEYMNGFIYANVQQWVTPINQANFIDTTAPDLDVLRFRFRPWIPSGQVIIFSPGTINP